MVLGVLILVRPYQNKRARKFGSVSSSKRSGRCIAHRSALCDEQRCPYNALRTIRQPVMAINLTRTLISREVISDTLTEDVTRERVERYRTGRARNYHSSTTLTRVGNGSMTVGRFRTRLSAAESVHATLVALAYGRVIAAITGCEGTMLCCSKSYDCCYTRNARD